MIVLGAVEMMVITAVAAAAPVMSTEAGMLHVGRWIAPEGEELRAQER